MRTTAKADYAVRAAMELAGAGDGPVSAEHLAEAQQIPVNFLENILLDLRRAGIVDSRRGAAGGYLLAKPADEIVIADVVRAVEGPLASVRGLSPDALEYDGSADGIEATSGSRCAPPSAPSSNTSRSPTSRAGSSPRTSRN